MSTSAGGTASTKPVHLMVNCSGVGIGVNPFTGMATFDVNGVTIRRLMGQKISIPWNSLTVAKLETSDQMRDKPGSGFAAGAATMLMAPRGMYRLARRASGGPEQEDVRVGTLVFQTHADTTWFLEVQRLKPYEVRNRLAGILPNLG